MLNYFVSLLERHLCIKYPNWYRRHFRSCWIVLAWQVGIFGLLCLATKGRHLFDTAALEWQWSLSEFTFLSSFLLPGLVLCLVGQVAFWITSCRNYPPIVGPRHPPAAPEDEQDDGSPFVIVDDERMSRLNLESSHILTTSFLILLGFLVPVLVALVLFVACLRGDVGLMDDDDCSYFGKILFYLRELVSIPCFFLSPIYFAMRNREILAAIRERVLGII